MECMNEIQGTWREPITNRSQADIENKTPRAYLNAEDLNRIEGNIRYLAEYLNCLRYRIQIEGPAADWERGGLPATGDIRRICDNIRTITDGYFAPEGFLDPADVAGKRALGFSDLNRLERYLVQILHMIENGPHFNRHRELVFTHGQLGAFTHEQLRKGRLIDEQ